MSRDADQIVEMFLCNSCPYCGAQPGQPCVSGFGSPMDSTGVRKSDGTDTPNTYHYERCKEVA